MKTFLWNFKGQWKHCVVSNICLLSLKEMYHNVPLT